MLLIIDGQPRVFVPIRQFRRLNQLPDDFGVPLFRWKENAAVSGFAHVQDNLHQVRAAVLRTLLQGKANLSWLSFALKLELVLRKRLLELTTESGLSLMEAEFTAACFGDLCSTYVHSCLRARASERSIPYFQSVYLDWLSETVRISQLVHCYVHEGALWRIQVVTHVFGRVGLIVDTAEDVHYVEDNQEANPAARFLVSLLLEAATHIGEGIAQDDDLELSLPLERLWQAQLSYREPGRN
jgi:hypothetical protein